MTLQRYPQMLLLTHLPFIKSVKISASGTAWCKAIPFSYHMVPDNFFLKYITLLELHISIQ